MNPTHEVFNQPAPLSDYNLFATNRHPLGVTFSTFDANGFDFHAFEV